MKTRSRRRVIVLGVLACLVLGGLSAVSASVPERLVVQGAHLRVRLTSSSDWAIASFTAGSFAYQRVLSQTPGTKIRPQGAGVELDNPHPGTTAVLDLDVAYGEYTDAASWDVVLQKGSLGTAHVDVMNLNLVPTPVISMSNTSTAGDYRNTVSLQRVQVMSGTPWRLRKADDRKFVLAVYYPWFTTAAQYRGPTFADRPSDPRDTQSLAGVTAMEREANASGIDGFVVSFAGNKAVGNTNGASIDNALTAAASTGLTVTGYLETAVANSTRDQRRPADPAVAQSWLSELLARSGRPGFLKAGGVPVVFVYQMTRLPPSAWHRILTSLAAAGKQVRLVGDTDDAAYSGVSWGVHRYGAWASKPDLITDAQTMALRMRAPGAMAGTNESRLFVGTVSPGYNDTALRGREGLVVARNGGQRFTDTWDAALGADPDWVFVSTWNEWFEGSVVEPSVKYGDTALTQTKTRSEDWKDLLQTLP